MKAGSLIAPVSDLDGALALFRDVMGFAVKFRDGDRYCAIDLGGFTLGLVAGPEKIVDEAGLGVKVADLEATLKNLLSHGAEIVRPAELGHHEKRAVLRAPGGTLLIVSEPVPR